MQVLLIEDDRHIALALRIRLTAAGYDVVIACSAAEALSVIDESVPDFAVIDINLPDGNGIEMMHGFAQQKRTSSIASIIMTASRKPGLVEEALAKGAVAFLEKPFPSAMLLDALVRCNGKAA